MLQPAVVLHAVTAAMSLYVSATSLHCTVIKHGSQSVLCVWNKYKKVMSDSFILISSLLTGKLLSVMKRYNDK